MLWCCFSYAYLLCSDDPRRSVRFHFVFDGVVVFGQVLNDAIARPFADIDCLGMSLHEFPSLSKNNDMVLQEGMVVTVEPGLVFAGWGSTRHSDTVVVRKDGIEILTKSPIEGEDRLIR